MYDIITEADSDFIDLHAQLNVTKDAKVTNYLISINLDWYGESRTKFQTSVSLKPSEKSLLWESLKLHTSSCQWNPLERRHTYSSSQCLVHMFCFFIAPYKYITLLYLTLPNLFLPGIASGILHQPWLKLKVCRCACSYIQIPYLKIRILPYSSLS